MSVGRSVGLSVIIRNHNLSLFIHELLFHTITRCTQLLSFKFYRAFQLVGNIYLQIWKQPIHILANKKHWRVMSFEAQLSENWIFYAHTDKHSDRQTERACLIVHAWHPPPLPPLPKPLWPTFPLLTPEAASLFSWISWCTNKIDTLTSSHTNTHSHGHKNTKTLKWLGRWLLAIVLGWLWLLIRCWKSWGYLQDMSNKKKS